MAVKKAEVTLNGVFQRSTRDQVCIVSSWEPSRVQWDCMRMISMRTLNRTVQWWRRKRARNPGSCDIKRKCAASRATKTLDVVIHNSKSSSRTTAKNISISYFLFRSLCRLSIMQEEFLSSALERTYELSTIVFHDIDLLVSDKSNKRRVLNYVNSTKWMNESEEQLELAEIAKAP